jgi:hypothetical protein
MIRHCVVLTVVTMLTTFSQAQHFSLPASSQAKTIPSPEGVDIYVRWGGVRLSLKSVLVQTAVNGRLR